MNDAQLAHILQLCIERLRRGETIADCLRDYPDIAEELAALLEAGDLARHALPSPAEVRLAQIAARARFEAALSAHFPPRRVGRGRVLAAAAGVALLLAGAALLGATSSLPGDALYPLKRWVEQVESGLGGDPQRIEQRRREEIRQLLDLGRAAEVSFSGTVEQVAEDLVVIGGIPVEQGERLALNEGDVAQVRGQTQAGRVLATQIIVIARPRAPQTTPEATPPSTARATATSTATFTASPSATPSATPTALASPDRAPPTATAGQNCQVRPPTDWVSYEVRPGDTLFALAMGANTTIARIAAVNCIAETDLIVVGQRLYLPLSRLPDPTPAPLLGDERPAPTNEENRIREERPSPTATRGQNAQPTPTPTRQKND